MFNVDNFFYKIMLLIPLTEMVLMRGDNVLRLSWPSGSPLKSTSRCFYELGTKRTTAKTDHGQNGPRLGQNGPCSGQNGPRLMTKRTMIRTKRTTR